jgi:hypothetical protein
MQEWQGHNNGVVTLMHLTMGQTSDWNPSQHIRMRHAFSVCIAFCWQDNHLRFPLAFKSNYSKQDFRGLFG